MGTAKNKNPSSASPDFAGQPRAARCSCSRRFLFFLVFTNFLPQLLYVKMESTSKGGLMLGGCRLRLSDFLFKALMFNSKKTNLAIAIDYQAGMAVPMLGACGVEEVARLMKRLALRYGIPIEENDQLVEKLFIMGRRELPEGFYEEIAEVIIKSSIIQE